MGTLTVLTAAVHIVIKMGLFDNILKPTAEVYCKNKSDWEPFVEGTVHLQTGR